ncbi:MAG: hypothetical protein U0V45_05170 [Flavobacteriales bacterium]
MGGPYDNLLGTASTPLRAFQQAAGSGGDHHLRQLQVLAATSAAFPVTINALPTVMVSPTTANFCIGGSPVAS